MNWIWLSFTFAYIRKERKNGIYKSPLISTSNMTRPIDHIHCGNEPSNSLCGRPKIRGVNWSSRKQHRHWNSNNVKNLGVKASTKVQLERLWHALETGGWSKSSYLTEGVDKRNGSTLYPVFFKKMTKDSKTGTTSYIWLDLLAPIRRNKQKKTKWVKSNLRKTLNWNI